MVLYGRSCASHEADRDFNNGEDLAPEYWTKYHEADTGKERNFQNNSNLLRYQKDE